MTRSIRAVRARVAGLAVALAVLIALSPSIATAAESYAEYHDLTSAEHSARVASLEADGYRPIALSVSGDPAGPRYAGAWVQRSGPAFSVFQDQTFAGYQTILSGLVSGGFQPTIVAATGPQGSTIFAGVLEETFNVYVTSENIDVNELAQSQANFFAAGAVLRWFAAYGAPGAPPKFAAIWEADTRHGGHHATFTLSPDDQKKYGALYEKMGDRPTLVVRSPNGDYSTIWEDSRPEGGKKAYSDLAQAKYDGKLASLGKKGWHVVRVAARGAGAGTLYDVTFAKTDLEPTREWHATGPDVPALAAFDSWMQQRMQTGAVRAGQMAIVRNGRLVYARGFTLAEPGYPVTQPTDLFLIGSTTKPLTSIVIHRLAEQTGPGAIHVTDTMQSILGISPPGGGAVADSRWNDITISQLINHSGGWDRDVAGDPLFFDDVIAPALGVKLPIDKSDIASFMAGEPLQSDPGSQFHYSNFGFLLAGLIAEKVTGDTYAQVVKDLIFKPLGLKRPKLAKSSGPFGKQVVPEPNDPFPGPTVLNASGKLVANLRGNINMENVDAAGGFVMSAPDYAKILAAFDQPTNPLLAQASVDQMWTPLVASDLTVLQGWFTLPVPDADGNPVSAYHQNGLLNGASTVIFHRADGISFVVYFNHDVHGNVLYGTTDGVALSALANQVAAWPSGDLFPTFDIPPF